MMQGIIDGTDRDKLKLIDRRKSRTGKRQQPIIMKQRSAAEMTASQLSLSSSSDGFSEFVDVEDFASAPASVSASASASASASQLGVAAAAAPPVPDRIFKTSLKTASGRCIHSHERMSRMNY